MECPRCGKSAKTRHGLVKHLTGTLPYGGHELSRDDAVKVVGDLEVADPTTPQLRLDDAPVVLPAPDLAEDVRESFLYQALARLVDNKSLPKYQFERTVDGFLGTFLPGILSALINAPVELVAQEFPLKKPDSNQSTNMDYILFCRGRGETPEGWIFLELKTDVGSSRLKQDQIYRDRLTGAYLSDLMEDVRTIASVSKAPAKYAELLGRFDGYPTERPIVLAYLGPTRHLPEGSREALDITFEDLRDIEVERFAEEWKLFKELALPSLTSGGLR